MNLYSWQYVNSTADGQYCSRNDVSKDQIHTTMEERIRLRSSRVPLLENGSVVSFCLYRRYMCRSSTQIHVTIEERWKCGLGSDLAVFLYLRMAQSYPSYMCRSSTQIHTTMEERWKCGLGSDLAVFLYLRMAQSYPSYMCRSSTQIHATIEERWKCGLGSDLAVFLYLRMAQSYPSHSDPHNYGRAMEVWIRFRSSRVPLLENGSVVSFCLYRRADITYPSTCDVQHLEAD
ncbi:hypothetical protein J6590_039321 [Homalodisca vitripennis]|nr:hypothetical protein J6590_039321 [Homalodisca vitripennis]